MRHEGGSARSRATMGRAAVLVAVVIPLLSGCGPAPWASDPTPSSSHSAVTPPVANDLSGGSTERDVVAGAVSATISYWSTLRMDKWTANGLKPVSLSMVTTVTPDDGQKVYLQKATMTAIPANATTTFDALDPQVDQATVSPGYLVLSPYSYSQTFTIGDVPAESTYVTLQFTYDFLVQTAPLSTEFAKQTATDTLTVAIASSGTSESDQ